MVDTHRFLLFFMAALVLAITPGPGIFYVLARSLAGGKREGIESSLGTFVGGLFHVVAAALGISAILAASAVAFHAVKYAGAAYLVFLGVKMIRTRDAELHVAVSPSSKKAFGQGNFDRGAESEDGAVFPFVHPAIYRAASGTCLSSVHRAGRNFGTVEYGGGPCGRDRCGAAGAEAEE